MPLAEKENDSENAEIEDFAQEMLNYVSQFMTLTREESAALVDNLNIQFFTKGSHLLSEGQVLGCYFVLKGCVRQYYLVDGEEKTTNFFTEGQPVTPHMGNFKRAPSKYFLSCVEDCVLTVGSEESEKELLAKMPQIEKASRIAVEEELGKSQDFLASYIINSPEERYLNLLNNRPDLLDRVPQYQLASYLGITPESLSRIRKRIMVKN